MAPEPSVVSAMIGRNPAMIVSYAGGMRRVLGNPRAYTILAPVLTVLGAATTIIVPSFLGPAQFIAFSLAMAVFQYVYDFDLGLSRLVDREFSQPNASAERAHDITMTRLVIAAVLIGGFLCVTPLIGLLCTLAGLSGALFMAAVGPIAFYRARSDTYAFTYTALLVQFGMTLPRLVGLLAGGVIGCVLTLSVWYGSLAAWFCARDPVVTVHLPAIDTMRRLCQAGLPLFVYGNLWTLYLLAPRWFGAELTSATDAGLFAFGSNLIYIGCVVVTAISQVYYPRHLANSNQFALLREMIFLFVLASMGVLLSSPLCYYGVALVFPKFAGAAASTAAILIGAIPIAIVAWIIPMIIALSARPIREATITVAGSIALLLVLMWVGNLFAGIVGQSWGCALSAFGLLVVMICHLHRHEMIKTSRAAGLCFGVLAVMLVAVAEWSVLFA
jgi:O-antigen/teichoic acid export membrane protein